MQLRNLRETNIESGVGAGTERKEENEVNDGEGLRKSKAEGEISDKQPIIKVADSLQSLQQEQIAVDNEIADHTSLESGGEARQTLIANLLNNEGELGELLAAAGLSEKEK